MNRGFAFKEALVKTTKDLKLIIGNRYGTWYIIDSSDRDYNSRYSLTKTEAISMGEIAATIYSSRN